MEGERDERKIGWNENLVKDNLHQVHSDNNNIKYVVRWVLRTEFRGNEMNVVFFDGNKKF